MNDEYEMYLKLQKEHREFVKNNYQPLHNHIYTLSTDIFVESFFKALKNNTPNSFKQILRKEHPGIYSFEIFQPLFCNQFLEEILCYKSWCEKQNICLPKPNSMNNYGVILNDFGFEPMLNQVMLEYIKPLSTLLFKGVGGDTLDSLHAFIVEYGMDRDRSLGFHTDDSEITLNACLGKEFTEGTLYYQGLRCHGCQQTPTLPDEEIEIDHKVGRAVLMRGQHRHGANDITSGERYNLIMWCRSSEYRQKKTNECPTWCGWHGHNSLYY